MPLHDVALHAICGAFGLCGARKLSLRCCAALQDFSGTGWTSVFDRIGGCDLLIEVCSGHNPMVTCLPGCSRAPL